jgi:hypothetical protein
MDISMGKQLLSAVLLSIITAVPQSHGGSLRDLAWLQGKCPEGGAVVWESGRSGSSNESMLKLLELSSGAVVDIEQGWQAEFSPDGSKIAWVKGNSIRGRMRTGDATIHTVVSGITPGAGVHWIGSEEVVCIKDGGWRRVKIDGSGESAVPELDALIDPAGNFGEVDVKLNGGVWITVESTSDSYKGSDGRSGTTGGECSTSLSPDGSFATGLLAGHDECNLTNTLDGGTARLQRTLDDCDSKGFDNHRWSSNDPRFIVAQYECENRTGVWEVGTSDVFLAGDCGGESYGDFTRGSGQGDPWPSQGAGPSIMTERDLVALEMEEGGAAPQPVAFDVYTVSGELDGVSAGTTPSWLDVELSALSGPRITVTNTIIAGGLAQGVYETEVTISSGNAGSVAYTLTLTVNDPSQLPPLTVVFPNGGETIAAGSEVPITWSGNPSSQPASVVLYLSIDGGKTWEVIHEEGSIEAGSALWGNYPWTVPATAVSDRCLIKVEDYNEGTGIRDVSDAVFTISGSGAHVVRGAGGPARLSKPPSISCSGGKFAVMAGDKGPCRLRVSRPDGARVLELKSTGPGKWHACPALAPGVYTATVETAAGDRFGRTIVAVP